MPRRLLSLLLTLNALVLVVTVALFWRFGLSYAWGEVVPTLGLIGGIAAIGIPHIVTPGTKARDLAVRDSFLVLALCLTFGYLVGTAQYPIGALSRPFVDATLARWDAAIGVSVPAMVAWSNAHPWWIQWCYGTYNSFLAQLLLPMLVVGFWYQDRSALWEYACTFHVCLFVTLVCFALWPAACAFAFYHIQGMFQQGSITQQLTDLQSGAMRVIHPTALTGLIAVPSFHTAGALCVLWSFRRYRGWFVLLAIIDSGLIAATMCSGYHYAVDVLAAGVLFGCSVVLYQWGFRQATQVTRPVLAVPRAA